MFDFPILRLFFSLFGFVFGDYFFTVKEEKLSYYFFTREQTEKPKLSAQ